MRVATDASHLRLLYFFFSSFSRRTFTWQPEGRHDPRVPLTSVLKFPFAAVLFSPPSCKPDRLTLSPCTLSAKAAKGAGDIHHRTCHPLLSLSSVTCRDPTFEASEEGGLGRRGVRAFASRWVCPVCPLGMKFSTWVWIRGQGYR